MHGRNWACWVDDWVSGPAQNCAAIDAADKGRFRILAGINEPGLLMLAETRVRTIPSNAHLVVIPSQQFEMLGRTPECVALQRRCLGIGPPKYDAYVNAASRSAIEHL
jgi:hypothetical protein